jgi:hypothetical protein
MANVVYQNITNTRLFKVEPKGGRFAIVEYRKGGKPRVMATYLNRAEAERELNLFAYDGFRRIAD